MKWIMLFVLLNGTHVTNDVYDAFYNDHTFPTKQKCETSALQLKPRLEAVQDGDPGTLVCFGVVIDQSSQFDVKTPPKAPAHLQYRKPAING